MIYEPALLDALEGVVVEDWQGSVWRVVIEGTDPLRPNQRGARWNPPGVEALYCSLEGDAALAETENVLSRQSVIITKPRKKITLQVSLTRVVLLSTGDELVAHGFAEEDLLSESQEPARKVGGAIAWLGIQGLLVPSRLREVYNLVIFTDNLGPGDSVEMAGGN